jgi:Gas vesicle synthesis protein GvpL/GvpF
VIYAYGICEGAAATAVVGRRGLGGARLRALHRGELAAVYSRHRSLRPRPTPELLLTYESVLEAIMAVGAVLPLRFGTQLEREEELAAVLADRHDELLRSLERVRGRAEFGIRLIPKRAPPRGRAGGRTGRAYLLARARDHRCFQEAIREVDAALEPLSVASCIREPRTPPAILAASYLVDSTRVAEFRERADQLARRKGAMKILVTGPWPPYSFAAEEHR